GPEGRVVRGPPRPVQLGVGTDGRDEHPVEREQGPDDEDGQRDVEEHPRLPPALQDHGQAPSSRRRYRSWTQTTRSRTGNMQRETAALARRRAASTPSWYAYVAMRWVELAGPPPVRT